MKSKWYILTITEDDIEQASKLNYSTKLNYNAVDIALGRQFRVDDKEVIYRVSRNLFNEINLFTQTGRMIPGRYGIYFIDKL